MRVIKEHDERRTEILDTAERLFRRRGYAKCTVNDILTEVGIAKGTFYHYFKSKEEVLDAIVDRYAEVVKQRAEKILADEESSAEEKLVAMLRCMRLDDEIDEGMLEELHESENALLHQKSLGTIVRTMAPLLAGVVSEGIDKNAWQCRYPLEYMEIFLAAALTLTDEGIFESEEGRQQKIMAALVSVLEKMLEMPEGVLMELFAKYWG